MKNKALTVVELLISLAIFAIIAVAIYSTFSTGIIGWRKGEDAISLFQEIRLTLDRINQEMRNQAAYDGVKLAGKADELYFITLIPFPEEGKGEYKRLAKLRYFSEEGENGLMLFRERQWVPCMEGVTDGIDTAKLISCLKSFDFQYGEKTGEEEADLTWHTDWEDKEKNPQAVKINLMIGKETPKSLSRVIYLPYGEEF